MILPDAPWVRYAEQYADDYYSGCYSDCEEEDDFEDDGDVYYGNSTDGF